MNIYYKMMGIPRLPQSPHKELSPQIAFGLKFVFWENCVCVCVHEGIYIYMNRGRDRERELERVRENYNVCFVDVCQQTKQTCSLNMSEIALVLFWRVKKH